MKPRILITTALYLPGYLGGGPVRSISNMVDWLSDDFEFYIFTGDRDYRAPEPYRGIQINAWNQVGKAKVFYASPDMQTLQGIASVLRSTSFNLLYLNSFFNTKFSLLPLLARRLRLCSDIPVLLAPRGEFSAGAMNIKAWKKRPFLQVTRLLGLYRGVHWHASTDLELTDICGLLPDARPRIFIARNLATRVAMQSQNASIATDHKKLKICFLSRISRKKNLDFALRVLAQIKNDVIFDIYGPQEDSGYWNECEQLISVLPKNITVNYKGGITNDKVKDTIAAYDLFFVPTLGENFGHVFLEAWLASVPVLVSDLTPWRDLASKKIGWDIPLNQPELFVQAIEHIISMPADQRNEWAGCCQQFARDLVEDQAVIDLNRTMFQRCIDKALDK